MSIVLQITARKGKPVRRGIDHYWSIMMDREMADETFTVGEILLLSEASRSDVNDFVRRLMAAGIIRQTHVGEDGEAVYKVAIRQAATPRVRRDGSVIEGASRQQCLWNAIRSPAMRQGFTIDDLVAWGSTDNVALKRATVSSYVLVIAAAGYLIKLDPGRPGRLTVWRLDPSMNTGPLPPKILRTKVVYDPNRAAIMGEAFGTEEITP